MAVTRDVRAWAADHVESIVEEPLHELERDGTLPEVRNNFADDLEDFFYEATAQGMNITAEEAKEELGGDPEIEIAINSIKNGVRAALTPESLTEEYGDSYRKSTDQYLQEEEGAELLEPQDLPRRQDADERIGELVDIALDQGVEEATQPEKLYNVIREDLPTPEEFRQYREEKAEKARETFVKGVALGFRQIGLDPDPEIVSDLADKFTERYEPINERLVESFVQEIYGQTNEEYQ